MLQCSECGEMMDELRPKFFMVLEKERLTAPNIMKVNCPKCGALNYALNTDFCRRCPNVKGLILDSENSDKVISVGCRGQCLVS
ncbi:MAG: hypothetical protein ACYDG6_11770 [Thermincolia bacterium]